MIKKRTNKWRESKLKWLLKESWMRNKYRREGSRWYFYLNRKESIEASRSIQKVPTSSTSLRIKLKILKSITFSSLRTWQINRSIRILKISNLIMTIKFLEINIWNNLKQFWRNRKAQIHFRDQEFNPTKVLEKALIILLTIFQKEKIENLFNQVV